MTFSFLFVLNSILFGIGLAMDAFSVSLANGLADPRMHSSRKLIIAGTFGAFQTAMPLLGWFCVHHIAETFRAFQPFIPWIALALLVFIGVKMILEAVRGEEEKKPLQGSALLAESLVIGVVTFGLCAAALWAGNKIGARISGKAGILGGVILILIGLEIFLTGILG